MIWKQLQRNQVISINYNGLITYNGNQPHITCLSEFQTSSAKKQFQIQLLEKAISSIEDVDIGRRDNTLISMAIDPKDIPEAKKRITRFRRKLCNFFERHDNGTEVYNLSIALFPLSKQK